MDKIEERRLKHIESVKRYQNKNRDKVRATNRDYYRRKYAYWYKLLSELGYTKCSKCGYDKCFAALDFHHTNNDRDGNKSKTISQMLGHAPTEKRKIELLEELKDCVILCANCHRELHNKGENNGQTHKRI